jgi:very-short-patch-repair endonuclease
MGRRARIPESLTRGPFTVADAIEAGLARGHLRGRSWRRVGTGQFVLASLQETPLQHLHRDQLRLPSGAAFSGHSAAWLHGLDAVLGSRIEATVPPGLQVRSRSGMTLHRADLLAGEVTKVRGLLATSLLRTMRDLCARSSLTEAVVVVDTALHARRVKLEAIERYVDANSGKRGVAMLRRALPHAEPKAESHMESRLRMRLVLGGLPRPEAQVTIRDSAGVFAGRVDLFYRDQRLGIEYDGSTHQASLAEDNRRQNRLLDAGVRLLRFTAVDIYQRPDEVVAQVRRMLDRPRLSRSA